MPKLRACLLLSALWLASSLSLSALFMPSPQAVHTASQEQVTLQTAPDAPASSPAHYELRATEGEVCVYQDGSLLQRTGVAVSSLPKEDRALLENGIAVDSMQALTSLLEDLCS